MNSRRRNQQRSRDEQQKIYDDKDRETFGDDFVADHQKHGQDHENPLIMPGHVHVQNILRGARRNSSSSSGAHCHDPSLSTGIPALDLQQQRSEDSSNHAQNQRRLLHEEDEFAGLMSQRERQWVINIQLNQLNFSEIAYNLNYKNSSHLSKQFKQVTGMSMTDYKNLQYGDRKSLDEIV